MINEEKRKLYIVYKEMLDILEEVYYYGDRNTNVSSQWAKSERKEVI